MVPLGELCEINVGRTPSRNNAEFWGDGEPWLSIADMNQGLMVQRTKEQITRIAANQGKQVVPGTVLLSFKLSIGKVAIAGVPLYTNEAIAALPIKDDRKLLPGYLLRALEAMDLSTGANRAAMGATLNKATLQQFRIPLPGLPEQRRIAAILDHADTLRAKRRRSLAHINGLALAVFSDKFGDPIANPHRYPVHPLNEWVDAKRPVTYGILKPGPDIDGGVPYVRVADMKGGRIDLRGVRRTTPQIATEYRRSTLATGDLLMSIRGHVGRFAFIPAELDGGNITQDSARLAIKDPASAVYLRGAMESPSLQRWLDRHTKGAAVRGINLGDLRTAPIPCPPISEQQQYASILHSVAHRLEIAEKQHAVIDNLFASLQSRAFRGEL
ncbi:restriction endonuclease subunit S [Mycolicibacter virginiensis]|nr:restriction endonuclease subunit S [Mycolicibacter virginiensis]ULP49823.1 restriction endonuclease subunit S [Mycolicibacter virginiensis]